MWDSWHHVSFMDLYRIAKDVDGSKCQIHHEIPLNLLQFVTENHKMISKPAAIRHTMHVLCLKIAW